MIVVNLKSTLLIIYLILCSVFFSDKTLKRGISHATDNVNIVSQARSELIFIDSTEDELQIVETPIYTFILPDLLQLEGMFSLLSYYSVL